MIIYAGEAVYLNIQYHRLQNDFNSTLEPLPFWNPQLF